MCQSISPDLSLPPLSALVTISLSSTSMTICFVNKFFYILFFCRFCLSVISFIFLCLTYFTMLIHDASNDNISFFMAEHYSHIYMCVCVYVCVCVGFIYICVYGLP